MPAFIINVSHAIHPAKTLGFIIAIVLLNACTSVKSITYFQNKNTIDTKRYATLGPVEPIQLRIQPDDILAIVVSSLSEETNALFNHPNTTTVAFNHFPGGITNTGSQQIGYPVNQDGEVSLPLGGNVKLAGLTLIQANTAIKEHLSQYIKDPSVTATVRILNHKITILGEVARPGVYSLLDNATTLPDIISTAGEFTVYGRRDNIMLIRTINDKREFIKLDLTSREILSSPYYFIENNDVLYVEPRPGKTTSSDRTLQLLPIILGVSSSTIAILSLLFR